MKVFLFDPETGLYAGEDFQPDSDLNGAEGVTLIPPPSWKEGEVPVFDLNARCWHLVPKQMIRAKGNSHD